MTKNKVYFYALLIFSVFSWSAAFSVVRDLVVAGFDPYLISFLRTIVTVLYFLPLILIKKKPLRYLDLKNNFSWLFGMGLIGVALFYVLSNIGLQYADAGRSSLIISISPGLVVLFGALVFKEPLTKRRIAGTAVSFVGVLIVIFANNKGLIYQLDFHPVDLLFLSTGLCATLYTIFNRFLGDNIDYTVGLFWCFLIGALALLPPAAPHLAEILNIGLYRWLELLFLGVVCGAICDLIWYEAIMAIGIGSCGLIESFAPLFGVIVAWLFLGEALTPVLIAGALILTVGVWMGVGVRPAPKQEQKAEERDLSKTAL